MLDDDLIADMAKAAVRDKLVQVRGHDPESTARPKVGERVELRDSIPGYEAGSRGVIVSSSNHGGVMVRFEQTGHAMLLRSEEIRIIDD